MVDEIKTQKAEQSAKHIGRPRLFKTPEEMQERINAYFDTCRPTQMIDSEGKPVFNKEGVPYLEFNPPTVSKKDDAIVGKIRGVSIVVIKLLSKPLKIDLSKINFGE